MHVQGWRWFTPLILHQSFSHLLSNLVVLVVVSTEMERQHGTLLAAAAFILSGMCGVC
jgi:membrane associated rhomboid family serine protease